MKVKLREYKDHYEHVYFPPKFIFKRLGYWLDRDLWTFHCSPSFVGWIPDVWNNILVFLTPWLKNRRNMMYTFINENCGKLLNSKRNRALIRNRKENLYYYEMKSGLFGVKLVRLQYLDSKGESQSLFLNALAQMFSDDEEESKIVKTDKVVLCKRWGCFTKKACQEFLDEAVEKTPDLEWWERDEKGSIVMDEEEPC